MVSPEDKFGIKMRAGKAPRTPEQSFSLIAGSVYVVGGILGFFITGFARFTEVTNHALFGMFLVNPFHNIVHIALGAFWLLAAFAHPGGHRGDEHRHRRYLRAGHRVGFFRLLLHAVDSQWGFGRQLPAPDHRFGDVHLRLWPVPGGEWATRYRLASRASFRAVSAP